MSYFGDEFSPSNSTQKFIMGVDGADSINQVMNEQMMDEDISPSSEFITSNNDHIIRSINDVTMLSSKMPEQELGRKLVDVKKPCLP